MIQFMQHGKSKFFGGVDFIAAFNISRNGGERFSKPVGHSRSKYTPHVGNKQVLKALARR